MTLDRYGRRGWARLSWAAALVAACCATSAFARSGYTVVDLGGVPLGSAALAISADGTIAGYELVAEAEPHATLFTNGSTQDLGTLGGDASIALGAGIGGRAVGWARLSDLTRHAFLYENGQMTDLGTLGGLHSQAFAVNPSGTVVGSSWTQDDDDEIPMTWSPAQGMKAIPVPEVHGGQALAINAAGDVVGYYIDSIFIQPFLYTKRGQVVTLPSLGGLASKVYSISNHGVAVGYALTQDFTYPKFHAVKWYRGQITDLGTMAGGHGAAYGVNDAGTIVGFSYDADFNQVAVMYREEGNLDLNSFLPSDTHWHLSIATGVANNGIISGVGTLDGVTRAFALVPDGADGRRFGLTSGLSMRVASQPVRTTGMLELTLDRTLAGPLRLYDVTGRRVAELARGPFPRGVLSVAMPADVVTRLRSGVYYARLEDGVSPLQQRVVVLK